jgi:hypothetical protein
MVLLAAAETHSLVVSFLSPELVLEVPEQNILELRVVLFSNSSMEVSSESWEQEFQNSESGLLVWLPGVWTLLGLNKVDKFISIFSLKSVNWEVFWDDPWEVNRVLSDQVHSVNMIPDIKVFELI